MVKSKTSLTLKMHRTREQDEIRALASRLLTVQDEERRRLSRDIHDGLCQQLAALAFDVGGLAAEPLPDAVRSNLQMLQSRLADLCGAAHNLAYQLHLPILEDLGLAASLQALCEEASHRSGMALKFRAKNVPVTLSMEIMSCLYRVAQEALVNAAKQSGAKHVRVALIGKKDGGVLSIRDDGVGFDSQAAKRKGGLGLVSMEERVQLVNGKISIQSKSGRGTKIVVIAPSSGTGR